MSSFDNMFPYRTMRVLDLDTNFVSAKHASNACNTLKDLGFESHDPFGDVWERYWTKGVVSIKNVNGVVYLNTMNKQGDYEEIIKLLQKNFTTIYISGNLQQVCKMYREKDKECTKTQSHHWVFNPVTETFVCVLCDSEAPK